MVIKELPIEIKTIIYTILVSFDNVKQENAYFWNENIVSIQTPNYAFRFDENSKINTLVDLTKTLISENESKFDMTRFPKSRECLLSQYICDKLQIDYLVEIGRNIVHKILVILEKHFSEEMDAESDLSRKKTNGSDQVEDLPVVGRKGHDPEYGAEGTRERPRVHRNSP